MKEFALASVPLTGRSLVEASAGTGKTHAITGLYLRFLLERGLTVDRILAVTFTEAATAELRDRVRRRLRAALAAIERPDHADDREIVEILARVPDREVARDRLQAALAEFDRARISTIHGFCQVALAEHAFAAGMPLSFEIVPDTRALIVDAIHECWERSLAQAPEVLVVALRRRGVTVKSLTRIALRVLADPRVPILPERRWLSHADPLAVAFAGAARAYDRAGIEAGWRAGNRRAHDVKRWLGDLDAYFADLPAAPGHDASLAIAKVIADFAASPFARALVELGALDSRLVAEFGAEFVARIGARFARRKHELGLASYDDLLQRLRDALERRPQLAAQLARRFPAVLVDEFQDTDPVQWEIFARLRPADSDEGALVLVGDPKQAIYAFRGADIESYLDAARRLPADRRLGMAVSWRADPGLVAAVNRLFVRPRAFLSSEVACDPLRPRPDARIELEVDDRLGSEPMQLLFLEDPPADPDPAIATLIADEIVALLSGGARFVDGRPVSPSDVAVLTRTNGQAFAIQQALRTARVPSVVRGDRSVLASPDAAELQRLLVAVLQPANPTAVRAALAGELIGVAATGIEALAEDGREWERQVDKLAAVRELWIERGFVQAFRMLLERFGIEGRLLSRPDGERRMTDLLHLGELLHGSARTLHLGPAGLVHHLAAERERAEDQLVAEAAQIRLESDERAVQVMTVHLSKGLEFSIVFCPYLWRGTRLRDQDREALVFHDREDGLRKIDLGSQDARRHEVWAEEEQKQEASRLLYVALTRARQRCVAVCGPFSAIGSSPIGTLLHAPAGDDAVLSDPAGVRDRVAAMGVDALWDDLERWTEPGVLGRRRTRCVAVPGVWMPANAVDAPMEARAAPQAIARGRRIGSFSGLVRDRPEPLDTPTGLDREDGDSALASRLAAVAGPSVTLAGFPAGAAAGIFFHDLLERMDFADRDGERRQALVAERLRAHGLDVDRWSALVVSALEQIVSTPFHAGLAPPTLGGIVRDRRLCELEFQVPVSGGQKGRTLAARDLALPFRRHPSTEVPASYADELERLGFSPLSGFLKGFVDMVFVEGSRWYVVDYKSNHLGASPEDYRLERLALEMRREHYVLQYHLYLVALLRFLQSRLRGFRFEKHFGGAYYLFLRGMTGTAASGVFHELPPRARLEELSAALGPAPRRPR